MLNDKRIKACITRCDNGAYSRIQFLTAVRHSMGAHTEILCPAADSSSSSDEDEASSATTTAADSSLWHAIVVIKFSSRLQLLVLTSISKKRYHISFRPFQQATTAYSCIYISQISLISLTAVTYSRVFSRPVCSHTRSRTFQSINFLFPQPSKDGRIIII